MSDDKLLAVLKEAGGPLTVAEIREGTGLSETSVREGLKRLNGEVTKDESTTPHTFVANDLPEEDEPEPKPKKKTAKKTAVKKTGDGAARQTQAAARDQKVLEALAKGEGQTKAQLAETVGLTESLTYLSIWRLAKAGKIEKGESTGRTPTWVATKA